jgi:6-phosphogluconolactonase
MAVIAGTAAFLAGAAVAQPTREIATTRQAKEASSGMVTIYVGTYTTSQGKGIYRFQFDERSGKLTLAGLAAELVNPSFLALDPVRPVIYAIGERNGASGIEAGAVHALKIEADTGNLRLLNEQPSGGRGPCHGSVTPDGKYVFTANYGSGSVAVLPVDPTGRLGEPTCTIQHSGPAPRSPRAHAICLDPSGRYVFAVDLGLDKVFTYRFDEAKGVLTAHEPPSVSVTSGAGPRHIVFHPTRPYAYVNNEKASSVGAFAYNGTSGTLTELQTVSTIPVSPKIDNTTGEIAIDPSGKHLYCSNRGYDDIAIFKIDEATGRLAAAGHESTRGKKPRHFAIDPSGKWLIAANQASDNMAVFRIDAQTGGLSPVGEPVACPMPACVLFMPE